MSPITKQNYRNRVADLEAEIQRARQAGHGDRELPLAHAIGNMHWEFSDFESARTWFDRALALARVTHPGPLVAIAWLHWKSGRFAAAKSECRAVVASLRCESSGLDGRSGDARQRMLACWQLAQAHFVLGEYEETSACATSAKGLLEGASRTAAACLSDTAEGFGVGDKDRVSDGLRSLRGTLRWPTFDSNPNAELYRFGLYSCWQRFGWLPRELADEDLDPGKWERFSVFG